MGKLTGTKQRFDVNLEHLQRALVASQLESSTPGFKQRVEERKAQLRSVKQKVSISPSHGEEALEQLERALKALDRLGVGEQNERKKMMQVYEQALERAESALARWYHANKKTSDGEQRTYIGERLELKRERSPELGFHDVIIRLAHSLREAQHNGFRLRVETNKPVLQGRLLLQDGNRVIEERHLPFGADIPAVLIHWSRLNPRCADVKKGSVVFKYLLEKGETKINVTVRATHPEGKTLFLRRHREARFQIETGPAE